MRLPVRRSIAFSLFTGFRFRLIPTLWNLTRIEAVSIPAIQNDQFHPWIFRSHPAVISAVI